MERIVCNFRDFFPSNFTQSCDSPPSHWFPFRFQASGLIILYFSLSFQCLFSNSSRSRYAIRTFLFSTSSLDSMITLLVTLECYPINPFSCVYDLVVSTEPQIAALLEGEPVFGLEESGKRHLNVCRRLRQPSHCTARPSSSAPTTDRSSSPRNSNAGSQSRKSRPSTSPRQARGRTASSNRSTPASAMNASTASSSGPSPRPGS